MARTIVLLTDFGFHDPFAGIMRCVIQNLVPQAPLIDLTHGIPRHDIRAAALALEDSLPWLPADAVLCAVVDPGVGSDRRALLVEADSRAFIAPDNGLLTPVLRSGDPVVRAIKSHGPICPEMSTTFHGRDVFAPAAALVARGDDPGVFTESLHESPVVHLWPEVHSPTEGALELTVLGVDGFGNCALNLRRSEAAERFPWVTDDRVKLVTDSDVIRGIRRTYADVAPGEAVLYFNSAERLEVAVNGDSAAARHGLCVGSRVLLRL